MYDFSQTIFTPCQASNLQRCRHFLKEGVLRAEYAILNL